MPKLPAAGAAVLGADVDPKGAALAYRRAGRSFVRVDLADRLASHARKVRSENGTEPVDTALATSIGLSEEAITALMVDVGFARAGDAWRWRRRGPGHLIGGCRQAMHLPSLQSSRRRGEDRSLPPLHPAGEKPNTCPEVDRGRLYPDRPQARRETKRRGDDRQRHRLSPSRRDPDPQSLEDP